MHVELATSNKGKLVQAEKASRRVIELSSRQGQDFEYYFDEDAIKEAVEERLGIKPDRPVMYALAISQLKMMKHASELAAREPEKAADTIPLVTDSIAATWDENGNYMGVNRDDLKNDPVFKERYMRLVNKNEELNYHAFASFTFPGDNNIYTVPTYLDIGLKRLVSLDDLPTDPNKITDLAEHFKAGYLRLEETSADNDFTSTKVRRTSTLNWDEPGFDRSEPARQYMGGTTYSVMQLIETMSKMPQVERDRFNGDMRNGNTVPFVRISRFAYADIVSSLPLPQPTAR